MITRIPEPRKIEIEIFGEKAFLQERIPEERIALEKAAAEQNGSADFQWNYVVTIRQISSALECNILPVPPWWLRPFKHFKVRKRNLLFGERHLKKTLTESQINFLSNESGKLDYGEEVWGDLKKKGQELAEKKLTEKPSEDLSAISSESIIG